MRVTDAESHRRNLQRSEAPARGYILDVDVREEAAIRGYFESQIAAATPVEVRPNSFILPDDYNFVSNNCATNAVDAIQAGLPWHIDLLFTGVQSPAVLEIRLNTIASPMVRDTVRYSE